MNQKRNEADGPERRDLVPEQLNEDDLDLDSQISEDEPLTPAQKAEAERRALKYFRNPQECETVEDILKRLESKLGNGEKPEDHADRGPDAILEPMRESYDFSKGRRNPYANRLKNSDGGS